MFILEHDTRNKKTLEEWDVGLSKHETWNDGILFLPMFPPQGVQDITLKVCQLCNTLQYYTRMINLGREIVIIISYHSFTPLNEAN